LYRNPRSLNVVPFRTGFGSAFTSISLGYGLDDWGSKVRFPAGAGKFSLHHHVPNGSGAQLAFYPMGTGGSFPGVKRPGREVDHSPPSSAEVKESVELHFHSSNTPSWRGAQLKKHRDNFAFAFYRCFDIKIIQNIRHVFMAQITNQKFVYKHYNVTAGAEIAQQVQ
jgi:hypothetical protein